METNDIKVELEKNLAKLTGLKDEVKLKLHLASLEAKEEWDSKLAPRVFELEQQAKTITESSRSALCEIVTKMEDFLVRLRGGKTPEVEAKKPEAEARH